MQGTPGLENQIIADRFKVGRRLGAGSFGELYAAVDMSTKAEVAIKTERARADVPQLHYESRVYKALAGGGTFIFNFQLVSHNACGMECMGIFCAWQWKY
jgi:hypothetical protein